MYGEMLNPMGTPPQARPAVPTPAAGPSPGAPPAAPPMGPPAAPPNAAPTAAPIPPAVAQAAQAKQQAAAEAAQRQAYEAHLDQFLWHAANDYAAKRISREDLKKASAYSGTQPYAEWRQENVQHLKEHAKASE